MSKVTFIEDHMAFVQKTALALSYVVHSAAHLRIVADSASIIKKIKRDISLGTTAPVLMHNMLTEILACFSGCTARSSRGQALALPRLNG